MPEYLGGSTNGVLIPELTPSEVFPLQPMWGSGMALDPQIATHLFKSGNVKIEQRFLLGTGARRFHVICELSPAERTTFRAFWDAILGAYGSFYYDAPNEDQTTTRYTCRFLDPTLTYEFACNNISTIGITLIEVPATSPTYTLNDTVTRFPDSALATALLDQVQTIVPLLKITLTDDAYDPLYLSDRRVTVGAQLYQPRILSWDGISQSLNGPADEARFSLGNADRCVSQLANLADFWLATLEFSLFHVETGIKIDLWKGYLEDWDFSVDSTEFSITGHDGLYALTLVYPRRQISRTCWKPWDDGINCPYSLVSAATPGFTSCDKSWDNCQARGMDDYFGGILVMPQEVRNRDNSTGTWGYRRSTLTSVSLIADSVYSEVVPEYYVKNWSYPLKVNAKLIAGRDEGDFYVALGLVSEGPIGAFGYGHLLDGQTNHGPGNYGLRESLGADPNPDPFQLPLTNDPETYGPERAAGTSFVCLKRSDTKGLQLSKLAEHALECRIAQGCKGWTWTAPGSRSGSQEVLSNPIWVAVNILLRALRIDKASAATQELFFDCQSAIDAAAICNLTVDSLCTRRPIEQETPPALPEPDPDDPEGINAPDVPDDIPAVLSESQFQFCGGLVEQKPLRDWLVEILNNCLGYFVMRNGKVAFGIRVNSSATETFTEGNIVLGSLHLSPRKPQFNDLTVNFADEEYEYVNNSVRFYDQDHIDKVGIALASQMNLCGASTKSQTMRIAISRLREEVGGSTLAEQAACRDISLRTTVLALSSEPGKIGSITHDDMPSAITSYGYGEFRMQDWRLRQDYSIEITGRGSYDSMYDYVNGPKPADEAADPLPADPTLSPSDWNFSVESDLEGRLLLKNFSCKVNALAVDHGVFEIYYIPEPEVWYTSSGNLAADAGATEVYYSSEPPVPGEWISLNGEIMYVEKVTASSSSPDGTATVRRGPNVWNDAANAVQANAVINASVIALDIDDDAIIYIEPGLDIVPGQILWTTPGAEWQFVGSYDSQTGRTVLAKPFLSAPVGTLLYTWSQIHRVKLQTVTLPIPVDFFRSQARARQGLSIDLPFAGVVAVRGYLTTRLNRRSNILLKLYSSAPIRTGGNTQYLLSYPGCPTGISDDAFNPIRIDQRQSFERAWAQKNRVTQTLQAPRALATITKTAFDYGGWVLIEGAPAVNMDIFVWVGDPASSEAVYVKAPPYTINESDGTTPEQVATGLAAWLNSYEQFAAFYLAEASGAYVLITDLLGVGGTILVTDTGAGDITTSASGLTSRLGVLIGRRYAITFIGALDSTGGVYYESDLSPLSVTTGPTGGATRIELTDLPISSPDLTATSLRIYALADGATVVNLLDNSTLRDLSVPSGGITATPADYGGVITIGGTPAEGDDISVSIGDPTNFSVLAGRTTPAAVAEDLADWLNTYSPFAAEYVALAVSNEVRITPNAGVEDVTLTAASLTSGSLMTVEVVGITPLLDIQVGRRYAISVVKTIDSAAIWESAPVDLGDLTGTPGSAEAWRRILLSGIPTSGLGDDADRLRIYAAPDGASGPWYLIGDIDVGVGTFTDLITESALIALPKYDGASQNLFLVAELPLGTVSYSDILTEAELITQDAYAGPHQPDQTGTIKVTVKRDGYAWFQVTIPSDQIKSPVIDGRALTNLAPGTLLNADIDNQSEDCELQLIIE